MTTTTHNATTSAEHEPEDESRLDRLRAGFHKSVTADFAPVPVLVSILIIAVIFQSQNERYLSSVNISNLVAQIAPLGFVAAGAVLILLIGEIDLSVGVVSGLAAAVTAVLNAQHGWPAWAAILAGLAVGIIVGLINGAFVTKFRLPSFVVTLAGLLTWQGVMFSVLGTNGTVNVTDSHLTWIASAYLSDTLGFVAAGVGVVIYAATMLHTRRRRREHHLTILSATGIGARVTVLAAVLWCSVAVLNGSRGVPTILVILLVVLASLDAMTRRRRFGRHIFAVGGNVEAASRSGIHVRRVKIAVFVLGSTLAAAGGIVAASRLLAVSTASGGSDLLLNAIAAAVIGGASLFGGRGSLWAALLGAVVIGCISNGMDLLSFEPSKKFIVTGLVLLGAVTADAALRNRNPGGAR